MTEPVTVEDRYAEVSLRAVELLARAQRAADEAVAEAQAYARDLEESAREQYRQILVRAQSAAHERHPDAVPGLVPGDGVALEGGQQLEQLDYVRTYARVAHSQLKAVLAALSEELDTLSEMAQGRMPPSAPSGPSAAVGDQHSVGSRTAGSGQPADWR
ncbi:MAG: hypothetical protein ACRCY8_01410 [Dermatophilaceae bacterium]